MVPVAVAEEEGEDMLDINTESLKQMASIAASANMEIEQAMELLNRITSHNDWCCSERYQINEGIQSCRSKALEIKDSSEGFLRAIRVVMGEFLEKEAGIVRLFENVEGVIKRALEIVAAGGSVLSGLLPSAATAPSEILSNSKFSWKDAFQALPFDKNRFIMVDSPLDVEKFVSDFISVASFEDLNL